MTKVAKKPVGQMTDEQHAEETLVTDHGVEGLVLHHDFDGVSQTFNGTLEIARPIAFEATFNTKEAWADKTIVRKMLIAGARYVDDGSSAAGHVAMNAKFKALLKYVMGCLNEQEAQTAE